MNRILLSFLTLISLLFLGGCKDRSELPEATHVRIVMPYGESQSYVEEVFLIELTSRLEATSNLFVVENDSDYVDYTLKVTKFYGEYFTKSETHSTCYSYPETYNLDRTRLEVKATLYNWKGSSIKSFTESDEDGERVVEKNESTTNSNSFYCENPYVIGDAPSLSVLAEEVARRMKSSVNTKIHKLETK